MATDDRDSPQSWGIVGVGTRKIAVDWRAFHFPKDGNMEKIVADLSQKQLQTAPQYREGEPMVVLGRPGDGPTAAKKP